MNERALEILETALRLATGQYIENAYEIKQRLDAVHRYLETQIEDLKNEEASPPTADR